MKYLMYYNSIMKIVYLQCNSTQHEIREVKFHKGPK